MYDIHNQIFWHNDLQYMHQWQMPSGQNCNLDCFVDISKKKGGGQINIKLRFISLNTDNSGKKIYQTPYNNVKKTHTH